MGFICKFSISSSKLYFAANHWLPAFAGMTGTTPNCPSREGGNPVAVTRAYWKVTFV